MLFIDVLEMVHWSRRFKDLRLQRTNMFCSFLSWDEMFMESMAGV